MCQINSRTVVLALVVCLARTNVSYAEQPDLPPIEAPPDGAPPQTGAFSQAAAPAPVAAKPAAASSASDSLPPELLIPMPGGSEPTPPPVAAPIEAAPATPAPVAPPADDAPVAIPTRRAPPTPAAPAPAPEAEAAPVPNDIPLDILTPPAPPAVATAPAEGTAPVAKPATTPAPVIAQVPAEPALPEPLAFDTNWKARFLPYAAIGIASDMGFPAPTETTLASQGLFTAGATLSVTGGPITIEGHFADSFYQQRYLTTQLATQGGLSTLDVSEQKLNADLTVGYELMHHIDPKLAKNVLLTPFVGGGARILISDSLPMNVVGPEVGGRLSIAASNALVFGVTYGFVPNLVGYQGPQLLFGAPKFDHTVDVDVSLRLFGAARARLSYLSEYMTLTSAYRAYQTVGVGFDYGF